MNKNQIFNIALAAMFTVTISAFSALNESRIDAYVSMFTLEYFVCLALFKPRRRWADVLAYGLFAVFSVIVAFRVLEVLSK